MCLNLQVKIELRGTRGPVVFNIVVGRPNCCKRKNGKKKSETEETIDLFVTFLSLVKFQLGTLPPPPMLQ